MEEMKDALLLVAGGKGRVTMWCPDCKGEVMVSGKTVDEVVSLRDEHRRFCRPGPPATVTTVYEGKAR